MFNEFMRAIRMKYNHKHLKRPTRELTGRKAKCEIGLQNKTLDIFNSCVPINVLTYKKKIAI